MQNGPWAEGVLIKPTERIIETYLSRRPSFMGFMLPLAVLMLAAIVSKIYWDDLAGASWLPATGAQVFVQQEVWRLWTTIFVHGDLQHLLSNAYMLGILSFFVYSYFGFWVYPIYSFLGAGLVNAWALTTYPPEVRLVGASGLVYLLAGFWLMMFLLIERRLSFGGRLLRVLGVGLLILFPTSFEPQVSYRTHAMGLIVGVVFAVIYFYANKDRFRRAEKRVWEEGVENEEDQNYFGYKSIRYS